MVRALENKYQGKLRETWETKDKGGDVPTLFQYFIEGNDLFCATTKNKTRFDVLKLHERIDFKCSLRRKFLSGSTIEPIPIELAGGLQEEAGQPSVKNTNSGVLAFLRVLNHVAYNALTNSMVL